MLVPGSTDIAAQNVFTLSGTQDVANGGTGYAVDDVLIASGGTLADGGVAATWKVTSISGGGGTGPVTGVAFNGPGAYTNLPGTQSSSPSGTKTTVTTTSGGAGSGATVTTGWTTVYWGAYPLPVLSFSVEPSDTDINAAISPAVQVSVVGNLNIPLSNYAGDVTISIGNNAGSPPGVLSGTLSTAAVEGVASFSNLAIDQRGAAYTLIAAAENLVNKTSAAFAVGKAVGGTITTSGLYTIHTFESSGTFTTLVENLTVDYLIVGGGGGAWEGGGGAGGLSYVTEHNIVGAGPISVTIGAGSEFNGSGAVNGGATTFITTVAGGGRGGVSGESGGSGIAGGCGGGGGWPAAGGTTAGGAGSVGFAGGGGVNDVEDLTPAGGGGGGMGAVGTNGIELTSSGNGGDGVQNSISGVATWYCGGGAGDVSGGTHGTAGQGRDGPGGGGSRKVGPDLDANDGIVIIRYLT